MAAVVIARCARWRSLAALTGAVAAVCALFAARPAHAAEPEAEAVTPLQVVDGVWLIPGSVRSDRQPDGNSVVIAVPRGLVVVDTGRHAWQQEAIASLARQRKRDVVAIVNTHWHLDHVSGNPALRQQYPRLRVYASNAIDAALAGFLPQSASDSAAYLDDESIPATMREDIAADAATIANGDALRPDVVIDHAGPRELGGRTFQFHVARDAVTAADIWLYEPRLQLAMLGDLVTLPAPFLDTACPQGWLDALQEVEKTPFVTAIPGHGAPMTREQVVRYRMALGEFIDCAASNDAKAECSMRWLNAIAPLLSGEASESARAQSHTNYYVDMLRANAGRSPYCTASADPAAAQSSDH